ncbi:FAD-dependent oxidoreductase [Leifsonia sp. F6_8S_P_1B]|uniref:FAD-dependent oxidoreductase n=1 Tax=Leifsonia williamsii TaxID=3035919 RepID=A0ABT8KB23_9MICO|nr:FAD-dependent oxidoreductase [Leifsonia williamsii]MDN4614635.1 FAD-dependent oxidoreductase [Leifsonia williamsii]
MSGGAEGRLRVAIVGTGVAGAATGFALARRGAAVTFVEAGLAGRATAAGAGIIQPWSSSAGGDFYRLYAAAADYYPELVERLAEAGVRDTGYHRAGALVVNRDRAVIDAAEERIASRAAEAATIGEVRRIGAAEARELFPPLADGFDALHLSGGARVDGRRLREALLAGAQAHGAELIEGTAALTESGGVEVEGRAVPADAVVVAAGAWTDLLLAPLGARVGVEPQRGQLVHLRVEGVETRDWPSVHPVAPHYLVAFDGGRVVAGATRETGSGFDARETADGLRQVLADALAVAPGLADATVIETRVGLRPLADGDEPVFGPVEGHAGLFVNAGFGAAGLTMGPLVGDLLARRVLDA